MRAAVKERGFRTEQAFLIAEGASPLTRLPTVALDYGFAAGILRLWEAWPFCLASDLKRRKAQESQTPVQQALVDIYVVGQQLLKGTPKISQITAQIKGFEQTDASKNFKALRLRQLSRPIIIKEHRLRTEFFRQKDCAHLARTKPMLSLRRAQARWVLNRLYFDPFGFRNFRCSGQARTSDDDFMVNFRGDVHARKKPIQEVKTTKLCQDNERG